MLFLNGIPIFTAELKNPLTGQTVEHAIRQYQSGRDPREPLLAYGRCLAHFAVDPDLVYATTQLAGPKARFLPFNQGKFGGAGNPPVPPTRKGYASAYLWEETWAKDSVLDLVRQFIHEVEEEDEKGRKSGKRFLIFPRYQQLDAVRRLVADARSRGAGQRYLIQHSAGSGESFTIAWLAHQLATLHDAADQRVFDSIVVVTDRRVLDRQLQNTMRQFEQTLGVVENIDTTSKQLKQALEEGKTIIVTTLQKFPVIAREIGELPAHGFSFPLEYFDAHGLALDWPGFLEDFHRHWPTDGDVVWVRSVLEGRIGDGAARSGERTWRRQTEKRAGTAKSVFHFDVQGSVAKSTHSGLPWLLYLRRRLGARVHFWPFDGWTLPPGRSAVVEVYPRLWSASIAREERSPDQQDAYAVAAWLRRADLDGSLPGVLDPSLTPVERELAEIEGWILGVR